MKMKKDRDTKSSNIKENLAETSYDNDYSSDKSRLALSLSILRFALIVALAIGAITSMIFVFVSIKTNDRTVELAADFRIRTENVYYDLANNLEIKNEEFASERLFMFFSRDEVYAITNNLWKYELLLNDSLVDVDASALTISPGDTFSIRETTGETLLPSGFLNVGKLTRGDEKDRVQNHFGLNKKMYSLTEKREGHTTLYTTEGLELNSGEKFNLLISVQLQERLGFERDVIEVTVR